MSGLAAPVARPQANNRAACPTLHSHLRRWNSSQAMRCAGEHGLPRERPAQPRRRSERTPLMPNRCDIAREINKRCRKSVFEPRLTGMRVCRGGNASVSKLAALANDDVQVRICSSSETRSSAVNLLPSCNCSRACAAMLSQGVQRGVALPLADDGQLLSRPSGQQHTQPTLQYQPSTSVVEAVGL